MKPYQVEIRVVPRAGLLDPPGNAILHALHALGYAEVHDVRVGKAISLELKATTSESAALARAEEMCRELLANPVTEDFEIAILELQMPAARSDT